MAGRSSDVRAGGAFVELYAKDKRFQASLLKWQGQINKVANGIQSVGLRLVAMGGVGLAALGATTLAFAKMGDELDKMSARTGFAVEFLSKLAFAADIGGTSIKAMEVGVRRLQRSAFDASMGLKAQAEAFEILNVKVLDTNGNLKDTETLFLDTAEALAKIKNNTTKAALASILFGRSGTQLLPMLKNGAIGMRALFKEAEDLGIVMSTEDATAAAELTDALTRLWTVTKRGVFLIGGALAPEARAFTDDLRGVAGTVKDWIKQNQGLISTLPTVALGVIGVGVALVTLALALKGVAIGLGVVGFAVSVLVGTLATLTSVVVFLASPVGVMLGLILSMGAAMIVVSGRGREAGLILQRVWGGLGKTVSSVLDSMMIALKGGDIKAAAQVLWAGLKLVWQQGRFAVTEIWIGMTGDMGRAWSTMLTNIAAGWDGLIFVLDLAWTEWAKRFKSTGETVVVGFIKAATRLLERRFGIPSNVFDSFRAGLDEQSAKRQAKITEDAAKAADTATSVLTARLEKQNVVLAAQLALLRAGDKAAIDAARARLAMAKKNLAAINADVAAAAKKRDIMEMIRAIEEEVERGPAKGGGKLPGAGALGKVVDVTTTFGGQNLAALGFGSSTGQEIANNTARGADATEDVEARMDELIASMAVT